jgi:hypothetical protein
LPSRSRQDCASHRPLDRGLFVLGRGEATIARGNVEWAIEHLDGAIQCWRPQRHIGRASVVHLVRRDDLMLGFLDRHQLAEIGSA